jgi:hypothetical protein
MAGNKSISVVALIEGREAIPVRALPFVTGWSISPDVRFPRKLVFQG